MFWGDPETAMETSPVEGSQNILLYWGPSK